MRLVIFKLTNTKLFASDSRRLLSPILIIHLFKLSLFSHALIWFLLNKCCFPSRVNFIFLILRYLRPIVNLFKFAKCIDFMIQTVKILLVYFFLRINFLRINFLRDNFFCEPVTFFFFSSDDASAYIFLDATSLVINKAALDPIWEVFNFWPKNFLTWQRLKSIVSGIFVLVYEFL